MALDTPLHLEGGVLPDQWHSVDLAMTGGAANTFVDVDAVIKVSEVR
jgi:hypothetical protein